MLPFRSFIVLHYMFWSYFSLSLAAVLLEFSSQQLHIFESMAENFPIQGGMGSWFGDLSVLQTNYLISKHLEASVNFTSLLPLFWWPMRVLWSFISSPDFFTFDCNWATLDSMKVEISSKKFCASLQCHLRHSVAESQTYCMRRKELSSPSPLLVFL